MPSQEELDALYKKLQTKRAALNAQQATRQEKSADAISSVPAKNNATTPEEASSTVNALSATAQNEADTTGIQSQSGILGKIGAGVNEAARVLAGGAGDVLAGALSPTTTIPQEAAMTEAARQDLNKTVPYLGSALDIGGDIAQAAALPGKLFSTPVKAMLSGVGLNELDTIYGRLSSGKPVGADAQQYMDSAAQGAVGGLLGFHLGNAMGALVSKYLGSGEPAAVDAAKKVVDYNEKLRNVAAAKMDASGVVIRNAGVQTLLRDVGTKLDDAAILSRRMAPNGVKGYLNLRDAVLSGQDISLRKFNEIRKVVRDSIYAKGVLKATVNDNDIQAVNIIQNEMKKFIENLPSQPWRTTGEGNLRMGIEGWRRMNAFHVRMARSEKVAELIINADAKSKAGGNYADRKGFTQALQDEFSSLTKSASGRRDLADFTPQQQSILKSIAEGNISLKTFNMLDTWFGTGSLFFLLYPKLLGYRALRTGYGAVFGRPLSVEKARQAVAAAGEVVLKPRVAPALGVGAVGGAMEEGQKEAKQQGKKFP